MASQLLFYIDRWFFHFGIAWCMESKYNGELYAIVDADVKSKKFFKKQQLVNFKKTWLLPDPILPIKSKPDLNYLKSFEEKYKINLWKIAYLDRAFYKYNPHYKFTENEILYMLEQKCKFYEKVLEEIKPDFFLTFLTVSYHHQLLYEICKSNKIKILMLQPIKFGHRMTISENSTMFDNVEKIKMKNLKNIKSSEDLQHYLKKFDEFSQTKELLRDSFESRKIDRYKSNLLFFSTFWDNDYQKQYLNFGRTRSKILAEKISRSRNRKKRQSFLDKHCIKNLEECKPYVYFPLHYEPERILLIEAPYYSDQIGIITNIAKSIPIGYHLCVKENYMMKTLGWRDISFYKEIMNLLNVKLVHPSLSPESVIKDSSLVITIAGTTGQEAAFYNKPTIVFTQQRYSILPSVHTLSNLAELPQAIHDSLKKEVSFIEIKKYIEMVEQNSFEFDWRRLSNEFAFHFGFKGPVMQANLLEEEIEKFLNKHKSEFKKLTAEYIKKINS